MALGKATCEDVDAVDKSEKEPSWQSFELQILTSFSTTVLLLIKVQDDVWGQIIYLQVCISFKLETFYICAPTLFIKHAKIGKSFGKKKLVKH
jgi:hypothetical protein